MVRKEKNMKTVLSKIAALLAFGIGIMAIYAGGKAVLDVWPNLSAVKWLTTYNLIAGVITVILTAPLIWKNSRFALTAAAATLGVHSLVMVLLQTTLRATVAPASLEAMTTRIIVWLVVLTMMLIPKWILAGRKQRKLRAHG
jgi:hypothetical protein